MGWKVIAKGFDLPTLSPEGVFRLNEPLAPKTTFRIGGHARFYAEPACADDLKAVLEFAQRVSTPVFFLGRGSNLLVIDGEVPFLVIRLSHDVWRKIDDLVDGRLLAGAGVKLHDLCAYAVQRGLAGFEFLDGIPGSLGGALRMNSGAMGNWIFELVESLRFVQLDGCEVILKLEELHYGYRHCAELFNACAVEATLRATGRADSESIRQKVAAFHEHRCAIQPIESSAGCVFKNPTGDSAGRLIDQIGFKGQRVGDAEVSTLHGNFIINRGAATSDDVIELIRRVRRKVWEWSGILLDPEVILLGKEWKDVL